MKPEMMCVQNKGVNPSSKAPVRVVAVQECPGRDTGKAGKLGSCRGEQLQRLPQPLLLMLSSRADEC